MTLYYLDRLNGDDANSGLTPDQAFKTYNHLKAIVGTAPAIEIVSLIEVWEAIDKTD